MLLQRLPLLTFAIAGVISAASANSFASPDTAGAGTSSTVAPKPKPKPKATRIAVRIDGLDMGVTIPPLGAAFVGDDTWTHVLAIVASEESANRVTLSVAIVAKTEDRTKITKEQVIQTAKLKQALMAKRPLTIVPGTGIAKEVFGAAAPKKIVISWAAR